MVMTKYYGNYLPIINSFNDAFDKGIPKKENYSSVV